MRRMSQLGTDTHLNDATIRQLVVLHQYGGLMGELLLLFDVVANIAQLLLHHADCLEVGRVIEGVASEQQQLNHVDGDVTPSNV